MSFFSPAVLCYEPITLQAGERLTLRYRVIVHPGRWNPAGCGRSTRSTPARRTNEVNGKRA